MATDRGPRIWFWGALGTLGFIAIALAILRFGTSESPDARLSLRYQRIDLVQRLRRELAIASEAEKSAVMAVTDAESRAFADQSRAASAAVEQGREDLGRLLQSGGTRDERQLLSQFSEAFAEYQRVDRELLDLAVRNTNLKAYGLAFGPLAESTRGMDLALSHLMAETATSSLPEAKQILLLAGRVECGALRIQALLPAHIAAESESTMDALEASMAKEDRQIRQNLRDLAQLVPPAARGELTTADTCYARSSEFREQILKLSRQNTNVRSLTVSLNEKRLIVLKCQEALADLDQAIRREPLPEEPSSPR